MRSTSLPLAAALAAALSLPAVATPATAADSAADTVAASRAVAPGDAGWLVVADPTDDGFYVADATTGALTGELDVELGTHAGVLQLGGGRIALVDESGPTLDVVRVDDAGVPTVVDSVEIPDAGGAWERAGWLAADPTHRYVVVGSDLEDTTAQQVTIADLQADRSATATITTREVRLATTGGTGTEEMQVYLVGTPLRLVVSSGGRLDAYDVRSILRGDTAPDAVASTKVGGYVHGPVVSRDGTTLGSTVQDGVDTVRFDGTRFSGRVSRFYPGPSTQVYRPRMAPGGRVFAGTSSARTPAGTTWDQVPAQLVSGRLDAKQLRVTTLGKGIASRVALTPSWAAVSLVAAGGDRLVLVRRAADGTYTKARTVVPLEPLANGPVAGQSAAGKASRFVVATHDGSRVFVTRGGEGGVTVVDPAAGEVVTTVDVDSPLAGGGYLTTIDPGAAPYDLIGR